MLGSVGCLRAVLAPLLVAEPVVPAIHTGERLLETTLKLLLDDVRRCSADKLLRDGTGGTLLWWCWFA